ncbi:MAG: hypothetical protein AB7H92_08350 [Microbacteriaceae bacterium]
MASAWWCAAAIALSVGLGACGGDGAGPTTDLERRSEFPDATVRDGDSSLEVLPKINGAGEQVASVEEVPSADVTTASTGVETSASVPVVGSLQAPIPLGERVASGDWEYQVVGFESGVDVGFNLYNERPPVGMEYVRVRVRARYLVAGVGQPWLVRLNLAGSSGRTYGEAPIASGGGGRADSLFEQPGAANGAFVEGWLYYLVSVEDAAGPLAAFDARAGASDVPGGVTFLAVK